MSKTKAAWSSGLDNLIQKLNKCLGNEDDNDDRGKL